MKENEEALDQGLVWIMEEHDQTPTRSELHALVKKAARKFNVNEDMMCRVAESSIVHSIKLNHLNQIG